MFTGLPFAPDGQQLTLSAYVDGVTDAHAKIRRPFRDTEIDGESSCLSWFDLNINRPFRGEFGFGAYFQRDRPGIRGWDSRRCDTVLIEQECKVIVYFSADDLGDQRNTPRHAGEAAGISLIAAVGFGALQCSIITYTAGFRIFGSQQVIVDGALDLFSIFDLTGDLK